MVMVVNVISELKSISRLKIFTESGPIWFSTLGVCVPAPVISLPTKAGTHTPNASICRQVQHVHIKYCRIKSTSIFSVPIGCYIICIYVCRQQKNFWVQMSKFHMLTCVIHIVPPNHHWFGLSTRSKCNNDQIFSLFFFSPLIIFEFKKVSSAAQNSWTHKLQTDIKNA